MNSTKWTFPYSSVRLPAFGDAGVATTQPLAAQAGLAMLARGGNAVDAAIATAIALTVVEPTSNGVGGDSFAIVWDGSRLHGVNGSGRSSAALTRERFAGCDRMPTLGWDVVTVPGAVSAWVALSRRFGQLPFEDLFEPAIRYAHDGYLMPLFVAKNWAAQVPLLEGEPTFRDTFMPCGRSPAPGERFRNSDLGRTLASIAETAGETFYRGDIAQKIAAFAQERGGAMTVDDLADHFVEWCDPIAMAFRDVIVSELPPNSQGVAALIALGILDRLSLPDDADSPRTIHLAVEAMRLGLADLHAHVADAQMMKTSVEMLLSSDRLDDLAKQIRTDQTSGLAPRPLRAQGTVYLASADRDGMMVSFIQSNYMGFGSGLVVPETGIALQNRGAGFVLEAGHPNEIGPRKRPMNTIIPGFLTRDGAPLTAFGVVGGPMQAQAHVQMVMRMIAYGQNPQTAADAPRWMVRKSGTLAVEHSVPQSTVDALKSMGHRIRRMEQFSRDLGAVQCITRLDAGGYVAASESRRDGVAAMI